MLTLMVTNRDHLTVAADLIYLKSDVAIDLELQSCGYLHSGQRITPNAEKRIQGRDSIKHTYLADILYKWPLSFNIQRY